MDFGLKGKTALVLGGGGGLGRAISKALAGEGKATAWLLSALPVGSLRTRADALARDIREVDMRIQKANWEVDLVD